MSQLSFLSIGLKGKKLKVENFLNQMKQSMPWEKICKVIKPYYEGNGIGRPSKSLKMMLKIHCLQQWYNLSDPAIEEAIYDRNSFQRFLDIDMMKEGVPDETTILQFRHLLEKYSLSEKIFKTINETLESRGILMHKGTIVDATIIEAPRNTKNKERKRDPEMTSTRKNNRWHFGMKSHIGVDSNSGLVHSVKGTTAKEADITHMNAVCHGKEKAKFGDKGYTSALKKLHAQLNGVFWGVLKRGSRKHPLTEIEIHQNKRLSSIRAKVEHPFQVIKCIWGYIKVRYKGLYKNTQQLFMLFGLCNIYKTRLMA